MSNNTNAEAPAKFRVIYDLGHIIERFSDVDKPARRARYRVVYDMGHTIDGFDAGDDLDEARDAAMEILYTWQADCDPNPDAWDAMVDECMVHVECLNKNTGEYEPCWAPSAKTLDNMLWKFTDEMTQGEKASLGLLSITQ